MPHFDSFGNESTEHAADPPYPAPPIRLPYTAPAQPPTDPYPTGSWPHVPPAPADEDDWDDLLDDRSASWRQKPSAPMFRDERPTPSSPPWTGSEPQTPGLTNWPRPTPTPAPANPSGYYYGNSGSYSDPPTRIMQPIDPDNDPYDQVAYVSTPPSAPPSRVSAPAPVIASPDDPDDDGNGDAGKPKRSWILPILGFLFRFVFRKSNKARKDGLVRTAKFARLYWLLENVVIPGGASYIGYFLFEKSMGTSEATASHFVGAPRMAMAHVVDSDRSFKFPIFVISTAVVILILMHLVKRWDVRRHYCSSIVTDDGGCKSPALSPDQVRAKQKVMVGRFMWLRALVAITIVIFLLTA